MRIAGLSLVTLLLWPVFATAQEAEDAWEQRLAELIEQTKTEAHVLLAVVLRDADIKFTSCQIDTRWSQYPINAYTAQKDLGSSIYADVIAPDLFVSPSDLIDPDGAMRGSFCPDNEAKALWHQMVDDFRSGAVPGERDLYNGKYNGPWRIRLRRTKIAVPVFDRTFATAVVVISFTTTMTWRIDAEDARTQSRMFDEAGYYRKEEFSGGGYTYVYRKQNGHWTRTDVNEDWTAN